mgnify:CR=1 FL=1
MVKGGSLEVGIACCLVFGAVRRWLPVREGFRSGKGRDKPSYENDVTYSAFVL